VLFPIASAAPAVTREQLLAASMSADQQMGENVRPAADVAPLHRSKASNIPPISDFLIL
jgi:hypothetical protein